jgi:hypothetical protein
VGMKFSARQSDWKVPQRRDHAFFCSVSIIWLLVDRYKCLGTDVNFSMACAAERDEILFHIASQQAARLHVMDLQILGTSASLASPAITVEYSPTKPLIGIQIQAKPRISLEG